MRSPNVTPYAKPPTLQRLRAGASQAVDAAVRRGARDADAGTPSARSAAVAASVGESANANVAWMSRQRRPEHQRLIRDLHAALGIDEDAREAELGANLAVDARMKPRQLPCHARARRVRAVAGIVADAGRCANGPSRNRPRYFRARPEMASVIPCAMSWPAGRSRGCWWFEEHVDRCVAPRIVRTLWHRALESGELLIGRWCARLLVKIRRASRAGVANPLLVIHREAADRLAVVIVTDGLKARVG